MHFDHSLFSTVSEVSKKDRAIFPKTRVKGNGSLNFTHPLVLFDPREID